MDSTTRSWGGHYSRYFLDGDRTLFIMEMNGLKIKHDMMMRSWQRAKQRYQGQPVYNRKACCPATGLHRDRSVPTDRCYLSQIKSAVNESLKKQYGDISNLDIDEDEETNHETEQKAKPKPFEPQTGASGSRDEDDDDDSPYGIVMCMSF